MANEVTKNPERNCAAILTFAITAIVLGSIWAIHARDSGILRDPQSAGIAASIAQVTVLIAGIFAMLIFSLQSFRTIGWRIGPFRAYVAVLSSSSRSSLCLHRLRSVAGGCD